MEKILKLVMPYDIERIIQAKKNDPISNVLMGSLLLNNQPHSVYFKFYSLQEGNRGLLNEVLGYLYGTISNIPQPEFAGVALVPTKMLRPFYPLLTKEMQREVDQEEALPAFFTTATTSTHYEFHTLNDWLRSQILKWKDFNKAVVFDEVIANTDRYPRNLIHTGNNLFCLIDNGFLATEDNSNPNWNSSSLQPKLNYSNQLASINQNDIESDVRKGNRFISVAEDYFLSHQHLLPEMKFWIDHFATNNKKDWQSFLSFLQWRTDNVNELISKRYGLLG